FSVTGTHTYTQVGVYAASVTVTNVNNPSDLRLAPDTVVATATNTVTAQSATHFSVGAPGTAIAGGGVSVTVTALDAFNNTATSYGGTVHFTDTDGAATLPANATLTNGVGTFPVTYRT